MTRVPKRVVNEIQGERPYTVSKHWFDGNFRDKFQKTAEWLDNNPYLIYAGMKLDYLITLLIRGYDIEEELGVVFIDIPNQCYAYMFIKHAYNCKDKYTIHGTNDINIVLKKAVKFTEEEAKDKFPNFRWVSLDELKIVKST